MMRLVEVFFLSDLSVGCLLSVQERKSWRTIFLSWSKDQTALVWLMDPASTELKAETVQLELQPDRISQP